MTGGDAGTTRDPIRILQHTLIDVCDLLGATFSLDGTAVVFVRRSGEGRQEWAGALGDWLVADGSSWRVVSDDEYGRGQAASARAAEPSDASPSRAPRSGALTS